ncbi:MAG: T9SS C-terminal target domain-containing protein [Calditrichaeota bacterium]|nr:MAG: T9SS C-terminal target domain-containing protein [Calditrichota bacterium]
MRHGGCLVGIVAVLCVLGTARAQDAHREIIKMERARFLRAKDRLKLRQMATATSARDLDVTYYRLELAIDPSAKQLSGEVTIRAVSLVDDLQEVTLDLFNNMAVAEVRSGQSLSYLHKSNKLTVTLSHAYGVGEIVELRVVYAGQPMLAGGFASFDFDTHAGKPIISTLSEPFGAPTWWPCKDDPADKADSVDVVVTVPGSLFVASNGRLLDVATNPDGTKTYFWAERYPISTYLVSVAITNYAIFSDTFRYGDGQSMPVDFFVYPEHLSAAQEDFSVTVPMLEYYSTLFGLYPFVKEKYAMAEFPWAGAMEHQTCTSYGSGLVRGDHRYDWVVGHELSHQWFGDLVTMKFWSHIWLNEGFASYAEALWSEHVGGEEAYHNYIDSFDLGPFPTSVFVYDSTDVAALFSRTVYDKGAWVLHMLRHVMGDDAFFSALQQYNQTYAFRNATTENFRDVCEASYGHDLDWFFQQWVYGKFRPSYQYSWAQSSATHLVSLKVKQVQSSTGLFKMPLDVRVSTDSGLQTFVVWDSLASQDFQLQVSGAATDVQIDPDGWVLKEIEQVPTAVAENDVPEQFVLFQNFPNPFNAGTEITYTLPRGGVVKLILYNVLGQEVRTLQSGFQPAGRYTIRWDGVGADGRLQPSGVYFYRIKLDNTALPVRKMLLLK